MTTPLRVWFPGLALPMCLVSKVSLAAHITTEFCFEQNIAFADGSVGDTMTGSYTTAYGYRVQFVRELDSVVVNDVYVDAKTDEACITLDGTNGTEKLSDNKTYTIKVLREAYIPGSSSLIPGNTIVVRTGSGGTYTAVPKTGLTPTANHTYSYANGDYWTRLAASDSAQILAAATWALAIHNPGVVGETFELRNAGCGGSGNDSCFDQSTEILWVGTPDSKFTIAFILGLALANFRNDHDDILLDDSADLDGCVTGGSTSGARMNTKEYQSQAAYHGFGSFYAAAVYNSSGADADCEYAVPQAVDWSANGNLLDQPEEDTIFSCEDSPAPSQTPAINDEDYLGQKCLASGSTFNRATRYDWLRMLWDYHTDSSGGGYTLGDIFDTWEAADPDTWYYTGNVNDPDFPPSRLLDATGQGIFGDWFNQAALNGTDR